MSDKHILKKYNISVSDLAEIFGAKNVIAFRNSSAYARYIEAAEKIAKKVETEIICKIEN